MLYQEWEQQVQEKQRLIARKARKWKVVEQKEREKRKIVLMEPCPPRTKKKRVLDKLRRDIRVYH
jgi:hypothetical protein